MPALCKSRNQTDNSQWRVDATSLCKDISGQKRRPIAHDICTTTKARRLTFLPSAIYTLFLFFNQHSHFLPFPILLRSALPSLQLSTISFAPSIFFNLFYPPINKFVYRFATLLSFSLHIISTVVCTNNLDVHFCFICIQFRR